MCHIWRTSTKTVYFYCRRWTFAIVHKTGSCKIDDLTFCWEILVFYVLLMAILGKYSNKMPAVHVTRSYCVPSLLYACEIWSLNNAFRKIFDCCWRENTKSLLFYCKTLPVDQHRILFYETSKNHSSFLTRVIAKLCQRDTLSIAVKYGVKCFEDLSITTVKLSLWETFAATTL